MYALVGKALVLHYRVIQYAKHIVPTHLNFIYRVDTVKGRVIDDLGMREEPLRESQFYYIGGWNRYTGMYHRFYLSGSILKRDLGETFWLTASSRELVKKLIELYYHEHDSCHILGILVDNQDVTHALADIKACIMRPNNITAAALVLLNKYLNTHDNSFRAFAVETLAAEVDIDSSEASEAKVPVITILDYDLCEHQRSGDDCLFT